MSDATIIKRLPFQQYAAHPAVNASSLRELTQRSPAHYRHYVLNGQEATSAMIVGRLFHTLLLEPDLFQETYAQPKPSKENYKHRKGTVAGDRERAEWEATLAAWQQASAGKEIVTAAEVGTAQAMAWAIREFPINAPVSDLITAADHRELTIYWREGDFDAKARLDLAYDGLAISDVKKAALASPEAFAKTVVNFGYHQQADWYCRGGEAAGILPGYREQLHDPTVSDDDPSPYSLIVCEPDAPWVADTYTLDWLFLRMGHEANNRALETIRRCEEADHWPGYTDHTNEEIRVLHPPRWAVRREEELSYEQQ